MNGALGSDEKWGSICYAYNLGQCWEAGHGEWCAKGAHVCILAKCRQPHVYLSNHKGLKKW